MWNPNRRRWHRPVACCKQATTNRHRADRRRHCKDGDTFARCKLWLDCVVNGAWRNIFMHSPGHPALLIASTCRGALRPTIPLKFGRRRLSLLCLRCGGGQGWSGGQALQVAGHLLPRHSECQQPDLLAVIPASGLISPRRFLNGQVAPAPVGADHGRCSISCGAAGQEACCLAWTRKYPSATA